MLKRASRLAAARIALALMLFAQGAMAWSACALPEKSPERALRAAVEHQGCEQMTEQSAASSVCFTHTLADKQSLYKAPLDIPAAPSEPALTVAPAGDTHFKAANTCCLFPIAATGPPRRILLQSFQI